MKKGRGNIQDDLIKSIYISHAQYNRPEKSHGSLGELEQYLCVNVFTTTGKEKRCCGDRQKDHHT